MLGICYGFQVLAFDMGGEVKASPNREFGYARLKVVDETSRLFKGLPGEMDVWMSHGDQVTNRSCRVSGDRAYRRRAERYGGCEAAEYSACSFTRKLLTRHSAPKCLRNFLFSICRLSRRLVTCSSN